jgi:hypothetical protein
MLRPKAFGSSTPGTRNFLNLFADAVEKENKPHG